MTRVYPKDLSEQGIRWAIRQEKKFDRTPIAEIDKWEYRHVQKLKRDFVRSFQKYD